MSQNSDQAKAPFKLPEIKIGSVDLVLVLRLVAAALLIAVSVFVKMPLVVRTILLVLAAAVAGFDVVLQAVNAVLGRDFFATPVILVIVTVASFCRRRRAAHSVSDQSDADPLCGSAHPEIRDGDSERRG